MNLNRHTLTVFFLFLILFAAAKEKTEPADTITTAETDSALSLRMLRYDTTGTITLGNNLATLEIPKGFKYLDPEQSSYVLHDLWGNPPSETTGMIFPSEANEFIPATWAIEISYDNDGHVKDDDAKDIKYDELLEQMQEQITENNPERKKAGYPTFELTGWASQPYYDSENKKLHWAKKLLFEGDSTETLNYNIRILGREGVLVLNAIGGIDQLSEIKSTINPVLTSVNFKEGNRYADFNESTDKVAAYGLVGLIAGGVLAKTGLFAKIGLIFAKFAKVIVIGVVALGGAILKFFKGKGGSDNA
jgi:uncharacterized membrane-anchored protein